MATKSVYAYIVQMSIDGETKYLFSKRYAVVNFTLASKYSCKDCAYIAFRNSEFYDTGITPKILVFDRRTRTISNRRVRRKKVN